MSKHSMFPYGYLWLFDKVTKFQHSKIRKLSQEHKADGWPGSGYATAGKTYETVASRQVGTGRDPVPEIRYLEFPGRSHPGPEIRHALYALEQGSACHENFGPRKN